MSYCAVKWSYLSPQVLNVGLKKADLAVLRSLCFLFNDKGGTRDSRNCYPGIDKLATLSGMKKSAVNNAKRRLFEKRLISWVRAPNFDKDNQKTNVYMIACPELEKILKRNEERLRKKAAEGKPLSQDDPMDELQEPVREPGFLFNRPDPAILERAFERPLSSAEAEWMADALSFVCDRPGNRKALFAALCSSPGLDVCRAALNRVLATSRRGRTITTRTAYLLKAIYNGKAPLSKIDPA